MPNLGPVELIIIVVIIIIIFGVGKLPDLGGALGKGIREFRSGVRDDDKKKASKDEVKAESKESSDKPS